jgi:hypothetical protein
MIIFCRAKTVRIGKWRWPPPKEDGSAATAEGFFEFKMRKMKEKGWLNNFDLKYRKKHKFF